MDANIFRKTELQSRLKTFALRVIRLAESLPKRRTSEVFARQIIRSASSVAANYRAACRARSKAEFISKLGTVEEEADETVFWIEMISETNLVKIELLESLLQEGNEIISIIVASRKTARKALNKFDNRNSEIENKKAKKPTK